jgi:hypothetical protein
MATFADYGIPTVIGTAAGFLGAILKDIFAARMKTDEELRDLRTPPYQELWKLTEALPKWPRAPLTYADLRTFSEHLKTWYFEKGGIYLSRRSHKRYSAVQDALADSLRTGRDGDVPDEVYEAVRVKCSALRTEMTQDLLSRREGSRLFA